jgi:hypothetical protein
VLEERTEGLPKSSLEFYRYTTLSGKSSSTVVVVLVMIIYLWLYSPFVGPWPLIQFLNPIHSR